MRIELKSSTRKAVFNCDDEISPENLKKNIIKWIRASFKKHENNKITITIQGSDKYVPTI